MSNKTHNIGTDMQTNEKLKAEIAAFLAEFMEITALKQQKKALEKAKLQGLVEAYAAWYQSSMDTRPIRNVRFAPRNGTLRWNLPNGSEFSGRRYTKEFFLNEVPEIIKGPKLN
jgi:hypothetical protein